MVRSTIASISRAPRAIRFLRQRRFSQPHSFSAPCACGRSTISSRRRRNSRSAWSSPTFAYTIDGEFSRDEALRQLTALQEQTRRLERAGAQLVVWSEGSYPVALPHEFNGRLRCRFRGDDPPRHRDAARHRRHHVRRGPRRRIQLGAAARRERRVTGATTKYVCWHSASTCRASNIFRGCEISCRRARDDSRPAPVPASCRCKAPGANLGPRAGDLLRRYLAGVHAAGGRVASQLTRQSDQRLVVRRRHSEPWEHLALAVFATIELRVGDGALGEFRRLGAHRSERPAAAKDLCG